MAVWSVDVKGIKLDLTGRSYCIVFVHNVTDYWRTCIKMNLFVKSIKQKQFITRSSVWLNVSVHYKVFSSPDWKA